MDRRSLITIAEQLVPERPSLTEAVRAAVDDRWALAELTRGLQDAAVMEYIDWSDDPEMAREALESLKFHPSSMSWDWWEEHEDDDDEDEDIERFLGLAGEQSRKHGVLLVELDLGADGYLLGFVPTGSAEDMIEAGSLNVVRRGWQDA
ncbi:hypothetical protein LCL87_05765 [Rhodococcus hoagii]|nr:hypothetical protein [Prescottella equi]